MIAPKKCGLLQQLGKEFGYNPEHLRQMAVKGRLKARLIGHTWVTTRADIEDYMRACKKARLAFQARAWEAVLHIAAMLFFEDPRL